MYLIVYSNFSIESGQFVFSKRKMGSWRLANQRRLVVFNTPPSLTYIKPGSHISTTDVRVPLRQKFWLATRIFRNWNNWRICRLWIISLPRTSLWIVHGRIGGDLKIKDGLHSDNHWLTLTNLGSGHLTRIFPATPKVCKFTDFLLFST
jgi:hypothetical protein